MKNTLFYVILFAVINVFCGGCSQKYHIKETHHYENSVSCDIQSEPVDFYVLKHKGLYTVVSHYPDFGFAMVQGIDSTFMVQKYTCQNFIYENKYLIIEKAGWGKRLKKHCLYNNHWQCYSY